MRWGCAVSLELVRQLMREKEVIGYAMDDHYQTPLISRAIRNAARNRKLAQGAIFHSDRGSNYMSAEYGEVLKGLGL